MINLDLELFSSSVVWSGLAGWQDVIIEINQLIE